MFDFFKEHKNIQRVINTKYEVIFYAENAYYYQYFRHLVEDLSSKGIKICYITSDKNDPLLQQQNNGMDVVFSKSTLAFLFNKLKAYVMVMTMPDLGQFIFKKSAGVKKYVYVFHALVSIHQQYRHGAFDNYDGIFCAGPHHHDEILESESFFTQKNKELVNYGYPLLNALAEKQVTIKVSAKRILIAPSWYEQGILQTCIKKIIAILGPSEYEVLIRPHPEFIKRNKKAFEQMKKEIRLFPNISMDINPQLWESMLWSNYLITDRSGIAFEFAFTKNRPVIFIETPLKIQNTEVHRFQNIPVENRYRNMIGLIVPINKINEIPDYLNQADNKIAFYAEQIHEVKKKVLFENSLQDGVQYILDQIS